MLVYTAAAHATHHALACCNMCWPDRDGALALLRLQLRVTHVVWSLSIERQLIPHVYAYSAVCGPEQTTKRSSRPQDHSTRQGTSEEAIPMVTVELNVTCVVTSL